MNVLLIDNYDSFTYTIVHYLEELGAQVRVVRNDDPYIIQSEIPYHKIVISPGPGLPSEAGYLMTFIQNNYQSKSLLGICLGQQAIAQFFGAKLVQLLEPQHGVSTTVSLCTTDSLYQHIPQTFQVGLYHSWHTVQLPHDLQVTSINDSGIIMSLKHHTFDIRAVQYHPESIMTPYGKQILKNWLSIGVEESI